MLSRKIYFKLNSKYVKKEAKRTFQLIESKHLATFHFLSLGQQGLPCLDKLCQIQMATRSPENKLSASLSGKANSGSGARWALMLHVLLWPQACMWKQLPYHCRTPPRLFYPSTWCLWQLGVLVTEEGSLWKSQRWYHSSHISKAILRRSIERYSNVSLGPLLDSVQFVVQC